jgi:hypothetical protein
MVPADFNHFMIRMSASALLILVLRNRLPVVTWLLTVMLWFPLSVHGKLLYTLRPEEVVNTTPPIPYVKMLDIPTWKTVLILVTFFISTLNTLFLLYDKISKALETCTDNVDLNHISSTMFISMYSVSQVMHVELFKIPAQIKDITCVCNTPIQRVRFALRKFFNAKLLIDWADLQLEAGGCRVLLPSTADIPLYRLKAAKAMARRCHTIRLTLVQGKYFKFVSTWTRLPRVPSDLPQPVPRE